MEYEFDYYFIKNSGEFNVPLLKNNDDVNPRAIRFLSKKEYAIIEDPVSLTLMPPKFSDPNLNVDYMTLPSAVFSTKIADVLMAMNIEGYQLVPAIIVDYEAKEHKNFWIENAYTRLECFDKEESKHQICPLTKRWEKIENLVLDKKTLENTELNNRLIFRSKETYEFVLYHKKIVDAILSVNPINIKFTPVEDWFQGIQFRK